MTDKPRLIEFAFPLEQTSLDSVHEKNVRHGHISTLHIWPARRPLAACRAALIATLLPDPGTPEARKSIVPLTGEACGLSYRILCRTGIVTGIVSLSAPVHPTLFADRFSTQRTPAGKAPSEA